MTVCRKCGREVQQRFVGPTVVWGHVTNPRDEHHPVIAKVAPASEGEKRAQWGNR